MEKRNRGNAGKLETRENTSRIQSIPDTNVLSSYFNQFIFLSRFEKASLSLFFFLIKVYVYRFEEFLWRLFFNNFIDYVHRK